MPPNLKNILKKIQFQFQKNSLKNEEKKTNRALEILSFYFPKNRENIVKVLLKLPEGPEIKVRPCLSIYLDVLKVSWRFVEKRPSTRRGFTRKTAKKSMKNHTFLCGAARKGRKRPKFENIFWNSDSAHFLPPIHFRISFNSISEKPNRKEVTVL